MDLTLFIVLIIISFMLYYLTSAIQSLIQEMQEVKHKCIKIHNTNIDEFNVTTADPTTVMRDKGIDILKNIKDVFTNKK